MEKLSSAIIIILVLLGFIGIVNSTLEYFYKKRNHHYHELALSSKDLSYRLVLPVGDTLTVITDEKTIRVVITKNGRDTIYQKIN